MQNHCITFTLRSTGATTKEIVVHSLSPEAEAGENDDFGVSDDSGDVFERRFVNCHYLTHFLPKKMAAFKVLSCSELKANLTCFKVCITAVGLLAQSAERGADNAKIVSSTITRMTTIYYF